MVREQDCKKAAATDDREDYNIVLAVVLNYHGAGRRCVGENRLHHRWGGGEGKHGEMFLFLHNTLFIWFAISSRVLSGLAWLGVCEGYYEVTLA